MNRRQCYFFSSLRQLCTKPQTNRVILPYAYNRNPRNLERLRLARKPQGYHFDNHFVEFWHRLCVKRTNRGVLATLVHNSGFVVVSASTLEVAFKKWLTSKTNLNAYIILAKVFAERCMHSGITTCESDVFYKPGSNLEKFLIVLQEEGISLHEPDHFSIENKWFKEREKKPWTVLE